MVKSMFAAVAGLRTHQSRMDVISNNIANVNTWGYKSRTANFQDAMYQNLVNSTGGNAAAGGAGGVNSSQLGYGVNLGSVATNFTPGSRGFTGMPHDCMIDGSGFFIVGGMKEKVATDAIGEEGLYLSRVGILSADSNGYIVDDSGNYIYGYKRIPGEVDGKPTFEPDLSPLKLDDLKPDVEVSSWSIQTDGSIAVVYKDNSTDVIGKLGVALVQNPNGLEQTSGYLFKVGPNAGEVVGTEASTAVGNILSNYLEMSNVDLATDISTMITTQRGYQANSKIITVTDQMLEELVNMKR